MSTYARANSYVIGTVGAPVTVAAAAVQTSTAVTLPGGGAIFNGSLHVQVVLGSTAPTSNPTVQFQYSYDGTTYWNDPNYFFTVPIAVPSATYDYDYTPNPSVAAIRVVVTNGAGQSITAIAQGGTLGGP